MSCLCGEAARSWPRLPVSEETREKNPGGVCQAANSLPAEPHARDCLVTAKSRPLDLLSSFAFFSSFHQPSIAHSSVNTVLEYCYFWGITPTISNLSYCHQRDSDPVSYCQVLNRRFTRPRLRQPLKTARHATDFSQPFCYSEHESQSTKSEDLVGREEKFK